jgi:four helix bundle protein
MEEEENRKTYDLEARSEQFARDCRALIRILPRTLTNREDARQLTRASGSVPANYLEANESLSKKDFLLRIKISRKEAKECRLWLRLLFTDGSSAQAARRDDLVREATELMNIFGAILRKSE